MTTVCPTCGQPLLMRHGIRLQRKKADILDAIEKYTAHGGITIDRLAWLFYPESPLVAARQCIRVQINQLNDVLVATEWRVVNRDGLYRLCGAAA